MEGQNRWTGYNNFLNHGQCRHDGRLMSPRRSGYYTVASKYIIAKHLAMYVTIIFSIKYR